MKNPIGVLRATALIEGSSFLVLLFLAMRLKYIWDQPMAVRIVGAAHGALWVAFCAMLVYTTIAAKWQSGFSLSGSPLGSLFPVAGYS